MKSKLTDTAAHLGNGAMGVAKNLQTQAKNAWEIAQNQTMNAVRGGVALARKRPLSASLVACGLGLVAGFLLKRNSRPDPGQAVRKSKGLLLGALIACGAMFKRTFSKASATAGTVGSEAKRVIKKVKRAARKTARKASSNGTSALRKERH